ncbi:MAG: Ava_C0101 and related proteins, partial [uncultured Gemmatimonadaceae bacterium]
DRPGRLASAAVRGLGAHEADAAPVHPDGGQGAHGARAVPQPLVARHAVRLDPRADDRADAARRPPRRDRARPARAPGGRAHERRRGAELRHAGELGVRGLPRGAVRRAVGPRRRRRDPCRAVRPGRQPGVPGRPDPRQLRPRRGDALLARPGVHRPGAGTAAQRLRGQGEPGAPVLALLRSRPRALLGAARAGRGGRRPHLRRGVLARGRRVRVLAGRRAHDAVPRLLLLHGARARRVAGAPAGARGGELATGGRGLPRAAALRRGPGGGGPRRDPARVLRERVRGRRERRRVGPRVHRAADAI